MNARNLSASLASGLIVLPVITLLQEGVADHVAVGGIMPNLVLLAVVNWGLVRGVEEGMLWGFIGGIFLDLFSGLPFGTSSFAFVAITGLVSLGETALLRTSVMLPFATAIIATVLYYAIAIVIVASADHVVMINSQSIRLALGVLIYNAVINPFLYVATQAFDRRLHPVARASF